MRFLTFSGRTGWHFLIAQHHRLFFSEQLGYLVLPLFRPVVVSFSSAAFSFSLKTTHAGGGRSAGSASNTRTKVRNPVLITTRVTQDLAQNGNFDVPETNRYRQDLGY